MNRQGGMPPQQRHLGAFNSNSSTRSQPPQQQQQQKPGWGAPPGVSMPQNRANTDVSSFAQSVRVQQPTGLDLNDFPPINPQQQLHQQGAVWNRVPSQQSPAHTRLSEDMFSQHHAMEDFRLGGQNSLGSQSQMVSGGDEFPALPPRSQTNGHMDNNHGPDTDGHGRGDYMLGSIGGAGQSNQHQQASNQQRLQQQMNLGNVGRPSVVSPPNLQQAVGGQSRILPHDLQQQQLQQLQQQSLMQGSEQEKKVIKPAPGMGAPGLGAPGMGLPNQQNVPQALQAPSQQPQPQPQPQQQGQQQPPQQQQQQQQVPQPPQQQQQPQQQAGFAQSLPHENGESINGRMSEADQLSLPGLVQNLRNNKDDPYSLTMGIDLTMLGLDFSMPDTVPIWPSFACPWSENDSRAVQPEFELPSCYTVQNTPPLQSKVNNFSDETLFYIFYTMPGDIMQEITADELTKRNWRYHTALRVWLTKDPASNPTQLNESSEKGVYIFFDPTQWERIRKEYVLDYHYLDPRTLNKN